MLKYVEFATKSKPIVRYELNDEGKVETVEVLRDGAFVSDPEIRDVVVNAVKYNVTGILGKELIEDEIKTKVAAHIAQTLEEGSRKR